MCIRDSVQTSPEKIILIDYPGFNLRLAKKIKKSCSIPIIYYISPQIWAWKENRVKSIKRYINQMYVILPFEKEFYEKKHNYSVQYFGHPLVNIIDDSIKSFNKKNKKKPIIAILPGSRKQEINLILDKILDITNDFDEYEFVIAGLNHIKKETYNKAIKNKNIRVVFNQTYELSLIHI